MSPELLNIASSLGPLGIIIYYLIWKEVRTDDRRAGLEKERIESDKALAAALAALTVTIELMVKGRE